MSQVIILLGITVTYLTSCFTAARMAYRSEYNKIYGTPAPQVYGGRNGHATAHRYAMREAMQWFTMWPTYLVWSGMAWLISHGIEQRSVELANDLNRLQEETDRLAKAQDRLHWIDDEVKRAEKIDYVSGPADKQACPCGYVTECPVHCGDGMKCHPDLREIAYSVIRTAHPEEISIRIVAGKEISIAGCTCPECDQEDPSRT